MSDLEKVASAIIEEEIKRLRDTEPVQFLSLAGIDLAEMLKPPTEEERFREGIARYLRALDWIAHDYRDDDVSGWLNAVKPFLTTIVGWEAQTDLGRAAGSDGYQRLHGAWEDAWDSAQLKKEKTDAETP